MYTKPENIQLKDDQLENKQLKDKQLEDNKAVVTRFNKKVIERGNIATFHALMDVAFVNRSAPPGTDSGSNSMLHIFN